MMHHKHRQDRKGRARLWLRGLPFLLAGLLLMGDAMAQVSMRCGTRLVSRGALQIEVLRACGEPVTREYLGSLSEGWLYGSRGRISKILIFRNGRLSQIKSGPRL